MQSVNSSAGIETVSQTFNRQVVPNTAIPNEYK